MKFRRLLLICYCAIAIGSLEESGQGAPNGLTSRTPAGPFLEQRMPPVRPIVGSGDYFVVDAFPNLAFEDPTVLIHEPNTNRLYVAERQGAIYHFVNDPGTASKTLFLDLRSKTQGYEDCGLLGMAFHPEWRQAGSSNRGYVYIYYQYTTNVVAPPPGSDRPDAYISTWNRLSRFTVPDGSTVADPSTELILINQFDRHLWHNGGGMFFGPDGFLYLPNGDEGGIDDEFNQAQRMNGGLFSGVLRIDVDQNPARSHPIRRQPQSPPNSPPSTSANYYIPNDNPWLDPTGNTLEEFYAIGLRSPHRMTFDPLTGQIWLGDIGQNGREEINLIEKGGNYQWSYREGTFPGPKPMPSPLVGNDTPPVYDYGRENGDTCVIGGYVYRGTRLPELYGKYIFGDNTSGRLFSMTYHGSNTPPSVLYLCNMPPGTDYTGLSSFGIDADDELYMLQMGIPGKIYKLSRDGPLGPPAPPLLSQTGAFTNTAALAPAATLVPYDVNSPLWSDGSFKLRWMSIPNDGAPYVPGEQIGFASTGAWTFPSGSVFVKHFELPTNTSQPGLRRRLETRLLMRDTNGGVYGLTYKWREDNSDADLLTNSLSENVFVTTPTGIRTQSWFYPSPQDCLTCHTPSAGHVLGVNTRQLNGDHFYAGSGVTDNQLRALNHIGMFNPPVAETNIDQLPRMVKVGDTNAPLTLRVRSYLDANCAQCHRPGGAQANWDARFDTPLGNQNILNGGLRNTLGNPNARVIAPGHLPNSMLHTRIITNGIFQMPPLARNLVDTEAVAALAEWINSFVPGPLPPPWRNRDIGTVGFAGEASSLVGLFNVSGSGTDIWGEADEFHFVHQSLVGDGEIIARVISVQPSDPWAKAGVMIREGFTPGARNAFMAVTAENGVEFQWRPTADGPSFYTQGPHRPGPMWVRLVRAGNVFTGYESSDGVGWSTVGSANIPLAETVAVGLAVTAVNNEAINHSSFDSVRVVGNTPALLPAPWQFDEVGNVGRAGTATAALDSFVIAASGTDLAGTADAFGFVYQPVLGDAEIITRVASLQGGTGNAKASLVLRESLAPGSRSVSIGLTRTGGIKFQWRAATSGSMQVVQGPNVSAPHWLRLVRSNDLFSVFGSSNGSTWTSLGSTNLSFHPHLFLGLAVSSSDNSTPATARFTNLQVIATSPTLDSDNDGMPDDYEIAHGFDRFNPTDAALDADQDQMTNLQEYWAGTNPRDASSVLRLTSLLRADNDIVLKFQSATGRLYAIERSTNASPFLWATVTNVASLTNTQMTVTNRGNGQSPEGYFRLRLVP